MQIGAFNETKLHAKNFKAKTYELLVVAGRREWYQRTYNRIYIIKLVQYWRLRVPHSRKNTNSETPTLDRGVLQHISGIGVRISIATAQLNVSPSMI